MDNKITETAHSLGQVVIKKLSADEAERGLKNDYEGDWEEIKIPFMNENLAVIAKGINGEEKVCLLFNIAIALFSFFIGSCNDTRFDLPFGYLHWRGCGGSGIQIWNQSCRHGNGTSSSLDIETGHRDCRAPGVPSTI